MSSRSCMTSWHCFSSQGGIPQAGRAKDGSVNPLLSCVTSPTSKTVLPGQSSPTGDTPMAHIIDDGLPLVNGRNDAWRGIVRTGAKLGIHPSQTRLPTNTLTPTSAPTEAPTATYTPTPTNTPTDVPTTTYTPSATRPYANLTINPYRESIVMVLLYGDRFCYVSVICSRIN